MLQPLLNGNRNKRKGSYVELHFKKLMGSWDWDEKERKKEREREKERERLTDRKTDGY